MSSDLDTAGLPPLDLDGSVNHLNHPAPRSSADTDGVQRQRKKSRATKASNKSSESRMGCEDLTQSPKKSMGPRRTTDKTRKQNNSKPRRVRTGCLTCRERHLKCDEALHRCQNCQRSGRICRRGVRLNFIDTQTVAPPYCIARRSGAQVTFRDDSRLIASEYVGGFERYPPPEPDLPLETGSSSFELPDNIDCDIFDEFNTFMNDCFPTALWPSQPENTGFLDTDLSPMPRTPFPAQTSPHTSSGPTEQVSANYCRRKICHSDPAENLHFRTFADHVGCWIDSLDTVNHFTQILPFHALEHPVIKDAFLTCGSGQLYLANQLCKEDELSSIYDDASQRVLASMQDPNRDSAMCAAAAAVFSVTELMCSKLTFRMNHLAGARALIKECGWDGMTAGLGGICFWLNVTMELLICLRCNWTLAWDPDSWGICMNMEDASSKIVGDEELWIHRIIYICAKVSNFRSSTARLEANHPDYELDLNRRSQEWEKLYNWCDQWRDAAPRSMSPLSYTPYKHGSLFPDIWLVKRSAIIARLFYLTARILLTQTRPLEPESIDTIYSEQQRHARDICGIVACMKDRGLATFPIWFLIIGAECLIQKEAQAEVLEIVDDILHENPPRAKYIRNGLRETWGWNTSASQQPNAAADASPFISGYSALDSPSAFTTQPKEPSGVVNPLMATADFGVDGHPYQGHYVPPLNRIDTTSAGTIGPAWFS